MPRDRRPPTPLDSRALERLALRYVERYATTRGRVRDYLNRKLRERGWAGDGAADVAALAERMAELGYVDDRGFAESRAAAMGRRGLGARRIALAMRAAGIAEEDAATLDDPAADDSALAFARRRRIGPFARAPMDREARARAFAAMLRAGHDVDRTRRILALTPDDLDQNGSYPPDRV